MDIKGLAKRMALATPFAALSAALATTSAYAAGLSDVKGYVETAQKGMGGLMSEALMLAAIVVAGIALVLLIYNIRQGKDYKKAVGFLVVAIIVFVVAFLYRQAVGDGQGGFFYTTGQNIGNTSNINDLLS